jgi:hypothetical protein
MTTFGVRLRALFLAVLFAAGSFGLPTADVLLDHGLGASHRVPQVHVEQRGGCHDPLEHCVLGRLLGELRVQSPAAAAIRLLAPVGVAAAAFPPSLRPAFLAQRRQPPSRAPPALV